MKNEFAEIIERHLTKERNTRNAELQSRLTRDKSFEEMLSELANLKGFNKAERAVATMCESGENARALATA